MEIHDGMPRPGRMFLSIVVPCCNEEEGLREFHRQMTVAARALCGEKFELIFVDDGSTDNTWKLINQLSAEDRNVVAVRLSRNHGHQLALTAGLSTVRGDLVLVIDADLQDPPELLSAMYDLMVREDADVVYGLRRSRAGESQFKKKSAEAFYRLLAHLTRVHIPVDTGDFRLMSRRISDQIVQMPEHDRFIRGMVAWLGFKQVAYEYDRNPRFAGTTKYPLFKMIGFAADALISFSMVPLPHWLVRSIKYWRTPDAVHPIGSSPSAIIKLTAPRAYCLTVGSAAPRCLRSHRWKLTTSAGSRL